MFNNLLRMFSGEINAARNIGKEKQEKDPDEHSTPYIGDKVKFTPDIFALKSVYGDPLPESIEMTLSEALEIIPRDRKRVDAYKALQKYLEERGVKLIIKSQKTKNNGN